MPSKIRRVGGKGPPRTTVVRAHRGKLSWRQQDKETRARNQKILKAELAQKLEDVFKSEVVLEHKFHPERRWRFDLAVPEYHVAIEINGGVWQYGRHNRASGYLKDMEKLNAASLLGWTVVQYTWEDVEAGKPLQELTTYAKLFEEE